MEKSPLVHIFLFCMPFSPVELKETHQENILLLLRYWTFISFFYVLTCDTSFRYLSITGWLLVMSSECTYETRVEIYWGQISSLGHLCESTNILPLTLNHIYACLDLDRSLGMQIRQSCLVFRLWHAWVNFEVAKTYS